jgi:hypothetical protein
MDEAMHWIKLSTWRPNASIPETNGYAHATFPAVSQRKSNVYWKMVSFALLPAVRLIHRALSRSP